MENVITFVEEKWWRGVLHLCQSKNLVFIACAVWQDASRSFVTLTMQW
jgi:hypothetical protein